MTDGPAKSEPIDESSAAYWKAQYEELEHNLRMWGVIEIMVRNPQVSEYICCLESALSPSNPLLPEERQ